MKLPFANLRDDSNGSVAIEFAILGPFLITMLLGIFQVGIGMKDYNALRSATGDIARFAVTNYQKSMFTNDTDLETQARTIATALPYGLDTSRLTVDIANAGTQRVAGATEKTITLTYTIPSVLGMIGMDDITIDYSRPVFLAT
jgi:Flp pilus assembly protein TadG